MIKVMNINQKNINFCGTTVIKKEGGSFLTKEILDAVNRSTLGFSNTRLGGYSLIIVSDVFKKEEAKFLKELKKKKIDYFNLSKVLNVKSFDLKEIQELIKTLDKLKII